MLSRNRAPRARTGGGPGLKPPPVNEWEVQQVEGDADRERGHKQGERFRPRHRPRDRELHPQLQRGGRNLKLRNRLPGHTGAVDADAVLSAVKEELQDKREKMEEKKKMVGRVNVSGLGGALPGLEALLKKGLAEMAEVEAEFTAALK